MSERRPNLSYESAIEAVRQRFPEKDIKAIYIKYVNSPEPTNLVKIQLQNNTFWQLQQKFSGNPSWKQMFN